MKRAVSISLGSSKRDKSVIIKLKDQEILAEHIGTPVPASQVQADGDIPKAEVLQIFQWLRLARR